MLLLVSQNVPLSGVVNWCLNAFDERSQPYYYCTTDHIYAILSMVVSTCSHTLTDHCEWSSQISFSPHWNCACSETLYGLH